MKKAFCPPWQKKHELHNGRCKILSDTGKAGYHTHQGIDISRFRKNTDLQRKRTDQINSDEENELAWI